MSGHEHLISMNEILARVELTYKSLHRPSQLLDLSITLHKCLSLYIYVLTNHVDFDGFFNGLCQVVVRRKAPEPEDTGKVVLKSFINEK
jgi:hypothetical protein